MNGIEGFPVDLKAKLQVTEQKLFEARLELIKQTHLTERMRLKRDDWWVLTTFFCMTTVGLAILLIGVVVEQPFG